MGVDKASLALGHTTMLGRTVNAVRRVLQPVIVVAAAEQSVQGLPIGCELIRDSLESPGPLAALAAALRTLSTHASFAFVTGCDFPLLQPGIIEALCDRLGSHDIVMCRDQGRLQPLLAVYRVDLAERLVQRHCNGRRDLRSLAEETDCVVVCSEELRTYDPELQSFWNVNTPSQHSRVLRAISGAGLVREHGESLGREP